MRGLVIVAGLALALLAIPSPAAAFHIGGSHYGPGVVLWACDPGTVGTCVFTVEVSNSSLIFFRFDLNADGAWDFPDHTGAASIGRWTTLTFFTWRFASPFSRACVQAWDGLTTRLVNGRTVPVGPMGCTDFVRITPSRWWRYNPNGVVFARFEIPSWLARGDFQPRLAEVEGVPAMWMPMNGQGDPGHWLFRVDRGELTRVLGPGDHTAHLLVRWAGSTFTAAGQVTIF
ncbi:MAG: hypothetical protein E6K18_05110 [Methanobacteriota archaeon]|nr:MAG: hypothetical protein E6K18_05110 [Euryarchaeota archaeon]